TRKLIERVLRVIRRMKVLGRKDQQAARNYVDGADAFPGLVGLGWPVVAPCFSKPRVLTNCLDILLLEHERARFLEAKKGRAARAFVAAVQVDDASERPARLVRHVVVRNRRIGALLADLLEPADVDARLRRPRVDLIDLPDDLLRRS